jgi:O-antigen/teichoic acid export membrane protein
MENRSFFRHAFLYGLGSVLVQAAGVVLVPLYTRCFSVAENGDLEVLGRCAEMAGTLLLIGGLRQGLMTFYQQSKTDAEREQVFRSTMALLVLISVVGGGLIMALAGPVCNCFQDHGRPTLNPDLLRLAVLAVLLEPLAMMPLALLQARVESALFVIVTLSQFVVRVALCVLFVVVLQWGVAGVFTATALTCGTYGIGLSLRELLRKGGWPDREHLVGLMRFALPFLPGALGFFILQHGDRFFLLHWRGEAAVGVYGLGYKVALTVATFSVAPLYMVWATRMYKAAEEPDAPQVFGRTFTRIMSAFMLVGLAACLFQDEAVRILGGAKFAGAAMIIAPVVLAGFFQAAAALMDAGFYVRRRTGLKLYITLAATVVILVLYVVLIPTYGMMGAAAATVAGFAFLAAVTWKTTQRIFPVEYEWGRLVDLMGLAAGLWLVSRFLPTAGWAIAAKGGLWLLWPLLVWICGLPSPEEKEYAFGAVRQTWARLRGEAPAVEAPSPKAPVALVIPEDEDEEMVPVEAGASGYH